MAMRIAMIHLTGGSMSGGYQVYLQNILPRLAGRSEIEAILCASPKTLSLADRFSRLPKVTFIPCSPFRPMYHRPDMGLHDAIAAFSPDIIFIPVERYLDCGNFPLVTMVQNMGPMVSVPGNPVTERIRYAVQRYEAKLATRNAAHVIVPTEFVHDFLARRWGIPPERMSVIHYGTNIPIHEDTFQRPALIPPVWKGNFIFTAGSIEPYRGLDDLFRAFFMIRDRSVAGIAIAGEARRNMISYQKKLQDWVARHGLTERILWVGHLDAPEMSWCYRNSRAFAMTSRVESLSIIGLEALAHGCVCIAADNPPLPEIFESAALYYTPYDADDLAKTMEKVLQWDQNQTEQSSLYARNRARTFSWDTNVAMLIEKFQEVAAHKKSPGRRPGNRSEVAGY